MRSKIGLSGGCGDLQVFKKDLVKFDDTEEYVIKGGRDKYNLLPKAFEGVKQVGVIGWGSQAPAQAQNMRDSFKEAGMDVKVAIGLRSDSPSMGEAEACGFSKADGTLGDVFDIISSSDLVVLLISDAAQVCSAQLPPAVAGARMCCAPRCTTGARQLWMCPLASAEFAAESNAAGTVGAAIEQRQAAVVRRSNARATANRTASPRRPPTPAPAPSPLLPPPHPPRPSSPPAFWRR